MANIKVLIFAFVVGFLASMIAGFSRDATIFMGQFIITLGLVLYADVISEIRGLKRRK